MNGEHASRGDRGELHNVAVHHRVTITHHMRFTETGRHGRDSRDDYRARDRDRRHRSRSPHHPRSSRREYEQDSYSSSRDYREREREDRYRDRREDRRDDRAWDRSDRGERGYRREGRREERDRPPRRERELFADDRRRRPERDAPPPRRGDRDRRRSPSPPPRREREPTPDLTDVVPILERKRRLTQWDIKPPGYDNITAEQAKLSGMFPLPGAPRTQAMDPSKLQALMNQPAGTASGSSLNPQNSKQAKRVFVKNLPESATEETLQEFFNLQLNALSSISGPDPCILVQLPKDRSFALLELKAPEDATLVLAMDGLTMEQVTAATGAANGAVNGTSAGLTMSRPKDYIAPNLSDSDEYEAGVVSSHVKDTPNKISVTNIPTTLTEEQVTELVGSFGELKAFMLVKNRGSEESIGIAFCEYSDPAITDLATKDLNDIELGGQHIKVKKACIGVNQASGPGGLGVGAMSMLAATKNDDLGESRVIQLLNMVTPEELVEDDEYAGKYVLSHIFISILTSRVYRNLRRCSRRVPEVRRR